jgi:hypothetical protein
MKRYTACAKVAVAVVFVMAVGAAAPTRAGPAVEGDQAAWQEVATAFQKLAAMPYRMKMTAPDQTVTMERVPPDLTRMITQITGRVGEVESVAVGTATRVRVNGPGAPGTWICSEAGRRLPHIDLRDFLGKVEASRGPDALIAGTPVHTFGLRSTFQGNGQTATSQTVVYIDTNTGLPRRSVTPNPLGPGEVVIDYYDYGAQITIALPPCP